MTDDARVKTMDDAQPYSIRGALGTGQNEDDAGGPSHEAPRVNRANQSLTHRRRKAENPSASDREDRAAPKELPQSATHITTLSREDLQPFADQLIAIAQQLRTGDFSTMSQASIKQAVDQHGTAHQSNPRANSAPSTEGSAQAPGQRTNRAAYAEMARASYAKRRKRSAIFGDSELFGEPAWDILLDLYIAQVEGKDVSVSSACIGSAAPPTTGLRWLGILAEEDLITREHDPLDQRRVLVRLTDKALKAMDNYFDNAAALERDRRKLRR